MRIFTFGCSFTEYSWPTWADLILHNNEGINYGINGGGYDQLLSNLVQCDLDNNLNEGDVVIIVFPNLLRWDCPFYPTMVSHGNILTSPWKKYIDELWSIEGVIYKNLNILYMIDSFLKNKKVTYRYGGIVDIFSDTESYFNEPIIRDSLNEYILKIKDNIPLLNNFYSFLYGEQPEKKWKVTKIWDDHIKYEYHPRPRQHYKWLSEILIPTLDIKIKITENEVDNMEKKIDILTKNIDSYRQFEIDGYFSKRIMNRLI